MKVSPINCPVTSCPATKCITKQYPAMSSSSAEFLHHGQLFSAKNLHEASTAHWVRRLVIALQFFHGYHQHAERSNIVVCGEPADRRWW